MTEAFKIIVVLSIAASIMVGIVLILRTASKKKHGISRRAFVFLWLLVFVRACLPFGFDDDFGLGWAENHLPGQVLYGAVYEQVFDGQEVAPAPLSVAGERELMTEAAGQMSIERAPASARQETGFTKQNLIEILSIVWISGAATFLLFFMISYIIKCMQIRRLAQAELNLRNKAIFEVYKEKTGVKNVRIKKDNHNEGATYGIISPVITVGEDNSQRLEMILLHELVHIKRKDNLKKLFAYCVVSLHWFNPLMWVALRRMGRDIEMACDETVVRILGTDGRKRYAGTILDCAQTFDGVAAASYFGESPLYERIVHIMSGKKKPKAVPIVCMAAILFLVSGCFSSPVSGLIGKTSEALLSINVQSSFQEFKVPEAANNNVIDYAVLEKGAVFVLDKENEDSYTFYIMNEKGELSAEYLLPKSEGIYKGSMYCDEEFSYFALDLGEKAQIRSLDIASGEIDYVTEVGASSYALKLFGGEGYLCWYEGNILKTFSLSENKASTEYITTGNQDYGAVLDGWIAYSYKASNENTMLRAVNLVNGEFYEASSALDENTYSVYGNGEYIVYKQDYISEGTERADGSMVPEVYIYDSKQNTTLSLWEMIPAEYTEKLGSSLWGINLLADRLIICGEGNSVYTVDLEEKKVEELTSEREGIGYYTYKNSGKAVSTMLYVAENDAAISTGNIYIARLIS